jgi:glycosyltransferase involved in cell wall biosynthesis
MKIAIYHELNQGGARRAINEFAKQLSTTNEVVDLYTIGDGNIDEAKIYSKAHFYKFNTKTWIGNNWKIRLYKDTIELFKLLLLSKRIASDINEKKYDLVLVTASQFIETPFILNFLKAPKYFYCQDPYYRIIYEPDLFNSQNLNRFKILYERENRFIRKYLDLWNVKKIDVVICASKFIQEKFYLTYGKKGVIVYGGVDCNFFSPGNKINKEIDVLFVGSKEFMDGYPLLEDILSKISTKIKVKQILSENDWLTDVQIRDYYRKSKLLIAAAYNEPLGLVPLEAMACGVVVLAVNEGGHKETIINGKTGYLMDRNAKQFAEKIESLLKNPELLKKLSNNAKKNMNEKWTWNGKGKNLDKILSTHLK